MVDKFDTIVCGLGAMGSAAIYQLAKRGNKVLGLDQFSPPHGNGSSHGESRIIRQAIGEGEEYVPLVLRSYELWREIENETGKKLLTITGGLTLESQKSEGVMHGRRDFLDQAIRCAEKFDIRHEILETADIRKRYPQFAVTDERAYFEYETGYLRPELCIEAQLHLAGKHGAAVQTDETVVSVESRGDSGVTVKTSRGTYSADKVIITAGPWITRFLPPAYAIVQGVPPSHVLVRHQERLPLDVCGARLSDFHLDLCQGRRVWFLWISNPRRQNYQDRDRAIYGAHRSRSRAANRRHGRKAIHVQRLCPRPLAGNFRSMRNRSKLPLYRDARFELRHRRSPG